MHGVAISDDDRYAFISAEGIGSEPGTVDVIDLVTRKKVAGVTSGSKPAALISCGRSQPVVRVR